MRSSWDILREMDTLRQEVDRVFRDAGLGRFVSPARPVAFLPGRGARVYPLLNVGEDAGSFFVDALAPGIDPDSLGVSVVGDKLTIEGEKLTAPKSVQPEAFHRVERAAGHFVRTLALPSDVQADKVQAAYHDGMLQITLPKAESAKPRQIAISMG